MPTDSSDRTKGRALNTTPPPPPPGDVPPFGGNSSPFGDDPKAHAKAAKAYAKAQRPWYKKKRFIIPIVFVVVAIAASASGGSDDGDGGSGSNNDKSDFSTNDENPPADDVEVTSCDTTVIQTITVGLKITNHSSKASNYVITIGVEDETGAKVGDGFASTNNVDPDQVANVEGIASVSGAAQGTLTCVIEEVERYAS